MFLPKICYLDQKFAMISPHSYTSWKGNRWSVLGPVSALLPARWHLLFMLCVVYCYLMSSLKTAKKEGVSEERSEPVELAKPSLWRTIGKWDRIKEISFIIMYRHMAQILVWIWGSFVVFLQNRITVSVWWNTPVIPATWKTPAGRSKFQPVWATLPQNKK